MSLTIRIDFMHRLLLSLALLAVAFVTLARPDWGRQLKGYGYYGDQFTIGGAVSGLSGFGLLLQINGSEGLPVSANGTFTFATAVNDGTSYSVTVQTQPTNPSQTCSVTDNDSGTLAGANVTNVVVVCTTNTFTIGGAVNGLLGSGLVLQEQGGDTLGLSTDGAFTFGSALFDGSTYVVTVQTQPTNPSQTCWVTNGSGTLGANITNVSVQCVNDMADLSVTKTDGQQTLVPGDPITYMITVTNDGPFDVVGARVQDIIPIELSSATWDCMPGTGASCTAKGIDDIDDLVNIPSGSTVNYVLTAATAVDFIGRITNTVTVTPPANITDPAMANNSAVDQSVTEAMFLSGFEEPLMVLKHWLENISTD